MLLILNLKCKHLNTYTVVSSSLKTVVVSHNNDSKLLVSIKTTILSSLIPIFHSLGNDFYKQTRLRFLLHG